MVQIINQPVTPNIGGFRHYQGLLPAINGAGDTDHASVRIFHVPAANAAAIFRGDILVSAPAGSGGGDLPQNVAAPSASVVIGNGGGSGLGNASMAPNVARWTPGDTNTLLIVGACVGFGPITLFQAKNGFQFIPATTEAWVFVETDPAMEFTATVPTVPGAAFNTLLLGGADVKANAGFQSTRFGVSGLSLDPATFTNTATLPLRILNSSDQIGNDPTSAGFVARVRFNGNRHAFGSAVSPTFIED